MLLNILRKILKNVQKPVNVFVFNLFEHFLAFAIEILSNIKLLLLLRFILFFILTIFLLDNLLHILLLNSKNIVQISLIDINIVALLLSLSLLKQLQIDLHTLFYTVMRNRPTLNHSVVDFAFFNLDNKLLRTLPDPLLQILNELLSVLAKVYIDPLSLGLQNTIFVDQNESHLLLIIRNQKIASYLMLKPNKPKYQI